MQWVLGVVYPGPKVQTSLNHFQYRGVRALLGCKRRANELWLDYELRTIRLSRLMVWRHLGRRWGDFALQLYWTYTGHRVRQCGVVSVASRLSNFRGLDWWLHQQSLLSGARHRRHFPALMNAERSLARAAGQNDWRELARDRQRWRAKQTDWIQQMQVPGLARGSWRLACEGLQAWLRRMKGST